MIRNRIVVSCKKGDRADSGQTSHQPRKRSGKNSLGRGAHLGMAARKSKTTHAGRILSINA
jgi:hypothetical protein